MRSHILTAGIQALGAVLAGLVFVRLMALCVTSRRSKCIEDNLLAEHDCEYVAIDK